MRLNKYISQSGLCSRRDADRYIEQGNVFIDGRRADFSDKVSPGAHVMVNGQKIEPMEEELLVFIALNKPVGIVSTTESAERDNIVDFVGHSTRIFPIGRLDKDSQGLILLTNNGDLVNKILRAGNHHEKEYLVTVNKPITDQFIQGMSSGVPILGVVTKKCTVTKVSQYVFNITLVQGLNRQIRRMCEYFGYEVQALERSRIMNISLKGLSVGDWRDLTEQEVLKIMKMTQNSSSEAAQGNNKRNHGRSNAKSRSLSKAIKKSATETTGNKNNQKGKKGRLLEQLTIKKAGPKNKTKSTSAAGKRINSSQQRSNKNQAVNRKPKRK